MPLNFSEAPPEAFNIKVLLIGPNSPGQFFGDLVRQPSLFIPYF